MKRLLFAFIAAAPTIPALAGDVSATIGIDQPGFYGQINIGDVPRPVMSEPMRMRRDQHQDYDERGEGHGHGDKRGHGHGNDQGDED